MRSLIVFIALGVYVSSCGEGSFNRRNPIFGDNNNPESAIPVLHSISGKELLPLRINLPGTDYYFVKESTPAGSILNKNGRELLWIPQKGQSGFYRLSVLNAANEGFTYNVRIGVPSEDEMIAGPASWYRQGDVGFIFVHGMSQEDLCAEATRGRDYWLGAPEFLASNTSPHSTVCYDGRESVDSQARKVAEQIIASECGAYGRCVVVTHSMGGLMLEYMMHRSLHGKVPEADLELFKSARAKIAFVVSIASAAGGSKLANILKFPERYPDASTLANIVRPFISSGGAVDSLQVEYASQTIAPIDQDTHMPFFMVPGYSLKEGIGLDTFNGMYELGVLDANARFASRSDGMVGFRSSCGVASDQENDGPGRGSSLESQFQYCFGAPKKPSHYVWFSINLNHSVIHQPFGQCQDSKNGCIVHRGKSGESYQASPELTGNDALNIMRRLLFRTDMLEEAP